MNIDWYALYNQVADYIGARPWLFVLVVLGPSTWVALAMFPFAVVADVLRKRRQWYAVPLLQKSHIRAGIAAAVLVALGITIVERGFWAMTEIELYAAFGIGAFAVLYLVVGIIGSRGRLRFDPMSIFWFGILGLGSIALLVMYGGFL